MKYLAFCLAVVLISACNSKKNQPTVSQPDYEELVDIPDTLVISQNMVVFWWPDSIQQIEMKEKYDEISYNTFVDDLTWYTGNAIEMLDSAKIPNKITERDVIIFKSGNNGDIVMKRKETKGNMVLFRLNEEPFITNMTDFDRKQVISYFR